MALATNAFTDNELLYYGINRNFPEDPFDNLLKKQPSNDPPDALVRLSENHPEIIPVVDWVVSTVMAPRRTIHIFSGTTEGFLKLRMAQHITDEPNGDFAVLIGSGAQRNLLQMVQPEEALEIVSELCMTTFDRIPEKPTSAPQAFSMSILEQLSILGACGVVQQNRYSGGWFTAASIGNMFDLTEINDFTELCAPIAEVAKGFMSDAIETGQFTQTLEDMMEAGMLMKRIVDTTPLYSFAESLQSLPSRLTQANGRFALLSTDKYGRFHFLYSLAGESGQWCFYANKNEGCLIKTGCDGVMQLLKSILIQTENHFGATDTSVQKYCTACGARIPTGSRFCGACGTAIK